MKNFFQKLVALPMWYSIAIVVVFSLLSAEMARELQMPILAAQPQTSDPMVLKIATITTFVGGVFSGFFSWALFAVLYHVFALLFGGKIKIKSMFKIAGLSFLVQIPFLIAQILIIQDVVIPEGFDVLNDFANLEPVKIVSTLNYIASVPYYALMICAVRYVYEIKWWRAFLAVAIPSAILSAITFASNAAVSNLVK